jgi:hypothetical protein
MGEAGVGLRREKQRIGGAGAGVLQIRLGKGGGPAGGEAVGEAGDVGQEAVEDVADGDAVRFGGSHRQPVGFEFGGIGDGGHGGPWGQGSGGGRINLNIQCSMFK